MSKTERDRLIEHMGEDIGTFSQAIEQRQKSLAYAAFVRLSAGLGLLAMELDDLTRGPLGN